jgi:hypothetical protein
VLTSVAEECEEGRVQLKAAVFPPHFPAPETSEMEGKDEERDELAARDAPPGTLRWKLISYMTDSNLSIKRLMSEFLFELCDKKGHTLIHSSLIF